jgi:chemotaxis protein histidine kinase CheA
LDCLPERRVLWRLLFKGSLHPDPQQQQPQQHSDACSIAAAAGVCTGNSSIFSNPTINTPASVATGLGALVSVYAATAFPTQQQQQRLSINLTGQPAAAAAPIGVATAVPATSYASLLVRTQSEAHLRQLLRRLDKRESAYVRAVNNAAAAAAGGAEHLAAAAVQVVEYLQQQDDAQQQHENAHLQQNEAAAAADDDVDAAAAAAAAPSKPRAAAKRLPNVPLLLQRLPLEAIAAAAEAARARVDLTRLHKEMHVAELGLELALHSRQQVEEEADAAATGQLPQVGGNVLLLQQGWRCWRSVHCYWGQAGA